MNAETLKSMGASNEELEALKRWQETENPAQKDLKREAWLKQRLGKFTASQASKLIGGKTGEDKPELSKGAITYVNEIVAEMITGESEVVTSEYMEHGNAYEKEAMECFIEQTGIEVEKYGENQEFVELGTNVGATPDGIISNDGGADTKCPKSSTHVSYSTDLTKENFKHKCWDYYWQFQHCMYVTGRKYWYFISYDPRVVNGNKLFYLKIDRSENDINNLKGKLIKAIKLKTEKLKKIGYAS